jgi:cytochrome c biogenesis factor
MGATALEAVTPFVGVCSTEARLYRVAWPTLTVASLLAELAVICLVSYFDTSDNNV